jgi:hypothetical protein
VFSHTARSQEGGQRREASAEPGFAGRERSPVREARSVPAAAAESTEEEAEDDQNDSQHQVVEDDQNDSDDDENCAYTHVDPLSLEISAERLLALDRLEECLEIAFSKPP